MLQLVWRAKRALALCILSSDKTESMTRARRTWTAQSWARTVSKKVEERGGERAVQWSGVEASSVWGRWRSVCYKWWSALTFSGDLSLAPHATAKDLKCNLCYVPPLPFSLSVCISFCLNVGGPRTIRAWEKRDWPRASREGTKTCCIIFYSKIA